LQEDRGIHLVVEAVEVVVPEIGLYIPPVLVMMAVVQMLLFVMMVRQTY